MVSQGFLSDSLNRVSQGFLSDSLNQEIYRPGTAISDASNPCTAVGGDQNKEIRGNASFVRGEGVNMKILLL